MRTASLVGANYFVTLINKGNRYSMMRFMKHKADTGEFVEEMILEAENVFNETIGTLYPIRRKKVKWIRSNGGGKYIAGTFREWFRALGTFHEIITAYSPESNWRAERLNRIPIYMARSMLMQTDAEVSEPFWAESILTANDIQKRMLTKSTAEDRTPYKTKMGRKQHVSKHKKIWVYRVRPHAESSPRCKVRTERNGENIGRLLHRKCIPCVYIGVGKSGFFPRCFAR